jgi:hypothetical protein
MSTIQELGAFLGREQAAASVPAPAPTTRAPAPATTTSTSPAVEVPATDAVFNADDNGAPAARQ